MHRDYLGADEIREMVASENIVVYYMERSKATQWATWAGENPGKNAALENAFRAYLDEYGDIEE